MKVLVPISARFTETIGRPAKSDHEASVVTLLWRTTIYSSGGRSEFGSNAERRRVYEAMIKDWMSSRRESRRTNDSFEPGSGETRNGGCLYRKKTYTSEPMHERFD